MPGLQPRCCGVHHRGRPGSIEQAHRPDEFVSQAQLAACDAWLDQLFVRLKQA